MSDASFVCKKTKKSSIKVRWIVLACAIMFLIGLYGLQSVSSKVEADSLQPEAGVLNRWDFPFVA